MNRSQTEGIDSMESNPGLLKRLQIRALAQRLAVLGSLKVYKFGLFSNVITVPAVWSAQYAAGDSSRARGPGPSSPPHDPQSLKDLDRPLVVSSWLRNKKQLNIHGCAAKAFLYCPTMN